MKLSLQRFLSGKPTLLILALCCFTVFQLQAQMVVCPSATDLGTFDCTNIEEVPDLPGNMEEAMAPPYNIEITGAMDVTRVDSDDDAVIFYCESDERAINRLIIIYNDLNFNFQLDDGEEVATCTYTIATVSDVTAPQFTAPSEFDANCVDGYDPETAGDVTVVTDDDCPVENVSEYVFFADAEADGACKGELIVTRSWTAVDPCGNTSEPQTQMIVVSDTEGPVFDLPPSVTIPCGEDPGTTTMGMPTNVMDECDPSEIMVNGIIVPDLTMENTPCPGSTTYTKRWGAVDDCGNATTMDQLIIVDCPADCTNDDICVGDRVTDPAPGDCGCTIVEEQVLGCTDMEATNFDPAANCACNADNTAAGDNECCLKDFDLALMKVLTSAGPFTIGTGASVTFTITVYNQGDVTAQNIEITDYIPTGLLLDDTNWTQSGATAVTTIAGPLAAGASTTVDITFTIDPSVMPGTYTNFAEISAAEDENGNPGMDIDSTPDNDPSNDNYTDDVIDNSNDDEDDHDGADFTLACATPTCNTDPCVGDVTALSADGCSCDVTEPQVLGCTDATACNYNPDANCDDGSCMAIPTCNTDPCVGDVEQLSADQCTCEVLTPQVLGCTDATACNYNPDANCDDGSCMAIPTCNTDPCVGDIEQLSADQCTCEVLTPQVLGCTDATSCNYNPDANCDDGSCMAIPTCNTDPCVGDIEQLSADECNCELVTPQVLGCTDAAACNFNPDANCDDGSCMAVPTCNIDPCVGDITALSADECSCELVEAQVVGCTDADALNYNPAANCPCDATGASPGGNECCEAKIFDLSLEKEVRTPGPYSIGQSVSYDITVTNEGNIAATNISIVDTAPPALTFDAAASAGWTATSASTSTTTIAGPIAPGGTFTVGITYTINDSAIENADITNNAEIDEAFGPDGEPVTDIDSTPGNGSTDEDDDDPETIQITCPDDAGTMGSALKSVCGGDNVNAPAEGVVIGAGSVHVYLLHDGTGSIIYDSSSDGTFVNEGNDIPRNIQLYISSVVGPPGPNGIPDLSASCTDVVLPGCPVIFYDPIVINHYYECDQTTGELTVNFSITGGGPSATGGSYSVTGSYSGTVSPGQQYIIDGITDGSTYSITVVNDGKGCTGAINEGPVNCTKTPIELISFDGEAQQDGNLLKWVTASEIENDFYTLERASVDMNFVEINQQQGAGTYSTTSAYTYLDREARNGLSYYRLTQTDFDGTSVIAGIVELQRSEATFDIINIHPIPVLDNFDLFIDSEEDQTIEIQVINSIGELMIEKEVELTNAVNKVEVDVSSLAGGVYVISALAGENAVSQKIIKY